MKSGVRNVTRGAAVVAVLTMLTACGGGDSGPAAQVTPPPPATYTVGGTVTGLSGSGLVLQNEGGDDLRISASGAFTFATRVPSGTSYAVTVKSSPTSPQQGCLVAGGIGTIAAADVTNVSVTCQNGYTVGGTVAGLQGTGLVLQMSVPGRPGHDVGPPLHITSNGPFTFDFVYANLPTFPGISQQPRSQRCVMHNAGGNTQIANVSNIEVGCSQFAYVANAGDNTVSAYAVDAHSGALAAVGPPVTTGMSPHAIVGTPDRTYVFVANEGSNDISAFAVNFARGALTPVPGSPFAAGTDPKALVLYYDFLYVANAGSDTVSAFAIDIGSGSLTLLGTFATGKGPSSIAVDRATDGTGDHMYVANSGGTNDVSAFSVDIYTGLLTPVAGSPFPVGANPMTVVIVGNGNNLLYTANPDATNPSISGFHFDSYSGVLTPLSGSPFPLAARDFATDPWGRFLYVATGNGIVGYGVDGTTGMLNPLPGFPVVTGTGAYSLAFDQLMQWLYVANDGSADVAGFRWDYSTGGLTPITGSPFPASNQSDFVTVF